MASDIFGGIEDENQTPFSNNSLYCSSFGLRNGVKLPSTRRRVKFCRYFVQWELLNATRSGRLVPLNEKNRLMTKPTNWLVRPAKTQISLGIRPVWSESSLSAWRSNGSLATHKAHSEDSDQTGRMPRLIWVFAGRTGHIVGFVKGRLNFCHFHVAYWTWRLPERSQR